MKTYTQFMVEAESLHPQYGKWGTVHKDGRIEDGEDHEYANNHADLNNGNGGSVDYAQDHDEDALGVRTSGLDSLHVAIKHFARLPHMRSGMVNHDHYEPDDGTTTSFRGKSYAVLNRMKELAKNHPEAK